MNSSLLSPDCAGVILLGGQSRRMGVPKDSLMLSDGRTMLTHVADELYKVCNRILLVGRSGIETSLTHMNATSIPDNFSQRGPLAGIEAALSSGLAASYLIVACDQPFVTSNLYARLLEGDPTRIHCYTPQSSEYFEPLPSFFPATSHVIVRAVLEQGNTSITRLLKTHDVDFIPLNDTERSQLRSCNTPADLGTLLDVTTNAH